MALIVVSDTPLRRRSSDAVLGGSAIDVAIVFEVAVYGAVGAWLAFRIASAMRSRRLPTLLATMWAFGAAMTIATVYAPNIGLASVRLAQLLVAIALVTSIYRRGEQGSFERVATAYVGTITALIALGLVVRYPVTGEASRFTWLYTHPVTSGTLLAVSVLILLEPRVLSPVFSRRPGLRWSLFVVHLAALLVNQSRGSAGAFLLGLAVWAWFRFGGRARNAILVILVTALPPLVLLSQDAIFGFVTRGQSSERVLSVNSRTDLWGTALDVVADKPVSGAGYAASRQVFLEEIGLGGAHNAHIEVLVNGGLMGVLPWALMLTLALAIGFRLARRHPVGPLLLGLFTLMMVNSMTAQAMAQGGTGATVLLVLVVAWMARADAEVRGPSEVRLGR